MSAAPKVEIDADFRSHTLAELKQRYDDGFIRELLAAHKTPVLVFDEDRVKEQYDNLRWHMPGMKHHFALKPLPLPEVARIVAERDGYIDVASTKEIEIARDQGFTGPRMVHTNPHKTKAEIKHAIDLGVRTFTIDNQKELEKFANFRGKVRLLLRLSFPSDKVKVNLSYKFGLTPDEGMQVLEFGLQHGYDIFGVSFHIGSQADHTEVFIEALGKTKQFFNEAKDKFGHIFQVLDIGGGFPAAYTKGVTDIEEFSHKINDILERDFPTTDIYSEPGRYIVNSSMTLFTKIVGKSDRKGKRWYFIDDGLYGSFSGVLFDFSSYILFSARELNEDNLELTETIIGGPTCDSHDVVSEGMPLPELEVGDVLIVPNIGAYSWTHSTEFNSIPRPKVVDKQFNVIA